MLSIQTLKQRLLIELDKLSAKDLQEILNFAHYLQFKQKHGPASDVSMLPPEDDPLLELIGIADVEPFSHQIDDLLYSVI